MEDLLDSWNCTGARLAEGGEHGALERGHKSLKLKKIYFLDFCDWACIERVGSVDFAEAVDAGGLPLPTKTPQSWHNPRNEKSFLSDSEAAF
jgi:hypothetical protein